MLITTRCTGRKWIVVKVATGSMLLGLVGCGFDTSVDDEHLPPPTFELLEAVSLGVFGAGNYACAVSTNDAVYCWGMYQPGREDCGLLTRQPKMGKSANAPSGRCA